MKNKDEMVANLSCDILKASGVAFGTSGARGLVSQFTDEVCAAFSLAFVDALKSSFAFDTVAVGIDRRPSSPAMALACVCALRAIGLKVAYYGVLPTPALAFKAMADGQPCIMITGSHIPFDRNGIKFYRPDGEISKADEAAILQARVPVTELEAANLLVDTAAVEAYCRRFVRVLPSNFLSGKRIGIYEHSSAGREIYGAIFEELGAEVVSLGRSDSFVPIDTEAVSDEDYARGVAWSEEYGFDFIFSTDGDGDRPLIADESGHWLRGDIVGLLTAQYLGIEALAVPVSCNSAIEWSGAFRTVERTRIGSPYVIEAMSLLAQDYERVAGFEANGGFLLGSDLHLEQGNLSALATRDALLPALAVMALAVEKRVALSDLVKSLPARFTASDRIQGVPIEVSRALIAVGLANPVELLLRLGLQNRQVIGFDHTDGLRLSLDDNTVVHLRPSGNAPELRCYVEADELDKARLLVQSCLAKLSNLQ